jgi:hypothetical protein
LGMFRSEIVYQDIQEIIIAEELNLLYKKDLK